MLVLLPASCFIYVYCEAQTTQLVEREGGVQLFLCEILGPNPLQMKSCTQHKCHIYYKCCKNFGPAIYLSSVIGFLWGLPTTIKLLKQRISNSQMIQIIWVIDFRDGPI